MPISKEIMEFAEVMTSRNVSKSEELQTSNFYRNMNYDELVEELRNEVSFLPTENRISAKTVAADIALIAMNLWQKL